MSQTTQTGLLYLQGADVEQHFFSDAELPFWQESNFRYLSGGVYRFVLDLFYTVVPVRLVTRIANGGKVVRELQRNGMSLRLPPSVDTKPRSSPSFRQRLGLQGYERPGRAEIVCGGSRVATTFNMTCMLFVKEPTLQDAIWNGQPVTLQDLRNTYQVMEARGEGKGRGSGALYSAPMPRDLKRTIRAPVVKKNRWTRSSGRTTSAPKSPPSWRC